MREIKFRFWDIEQPYMMSWEEAQKEWEFDGYANNMLGGDHWIPMEFTGVKDCKGTDIYEGDVIKLMSRGMYFTCFIELIGMGFDFTPCDADSIQWSHMLYSPDYESFEVIGNIHENPELIEVTK